MTLDLLRQARPYLDASYRHANRNDDCGKEAALGKLLAAIDAVLCGEDAQIDADLEAAGIDMAPANERLHAMVEKYKAPAPPAPAPASVEGEREAPEKKRYLCIALAKSLNGGWKQQTISPGVQVLAKYLDGEAPVLEIGGLVYDADCFEEVKDEPAPPAPADVERLAERILIAVGCATYAEDEHGNDGYVCNPEHVREAANEIAAALTARDAMWQGKMDFLEGRRRQEIERLKEEATTRDAQHAAEREYANYVYKITKESLTQRATAAEAELALLRREFGGLVALSTTNANVALQAALTAAEAERDEALRMLRRIGIHASHLTGDPDNVSAEDGAKIDSCMANPLAAEDLVSDRISELECSLAQTGAERDELRRQVESLRQECDALLSQRNTYCLKARELEPERDRLRAALEQMRLAAHWFGNNPPDTPIPEWVCSAMSNSSHLRSARAAVGGESQ